MVGRPLPRPPCPWAALSLGRCRLRPPQAARRLPDHCRWSTRPGARTVHGEIRATGGTGRALGAPSCPPVVVAAHLARPGGVAFARRATRCRPPAGSRAPDILRNDRPGSTTPGRGRRRGRGQPSRASDPPRLRSGRDNPRSPAHPGFSPSGHYASGERVTQEPARCRLPGRGPATARGPGPGPGRPLRRASDPPGGRLAQRASARSRYSRNAYSTTTTPLPMPPTSPI